MAYHPTSTYTYSSWSSWDYSIQAGPSVPLSLNSWGINPFEECPPTSIHPDPRDIPISKYSTLAGALTPVDPTLQGGVRPYGPASQQDQHQLVQPTSPQLVAPLHPGVRTQFRKPDRNAGPRKAYVLVEAPPRRPRQPAGIARFCRVNGCKRWTTESGKKLDRHRETHFPGRVGVACPNCREVFSRSGACGRHLKTCNRRLWEERAATKGTQDPWGERVGRGLISSILVDDTYTPQARDKLP